MNIHFVHHLVQQSLGSLIINQAVIQQSVVCLITSRFVDSSAGTFNNQQFGSTISRFVQQSVDLFNNLDLFKNQRVMCNIFVNCKLFSSGYLQQIYHVHTHLNKTCLNQIWHIQNCTC